MKYAQFFGRAGFVLVVCLLQACASVAHRDPRDPLESWNRGVFEFNDALDRAVVKPVATAYRDGLPSWMRTGIHNFFDNLEDVWSGVNSLLQFRGLQAADNLGRFVINTTMGLGGLLDVAGEMGMERHPTNFGLTLGRWGVGEGPYLVLPFLGSSTVRDALGSGVDRGYSVIANLPDVGDRDRLTVLKLIDTRATYLRAGEVVAGAALDPYSFTRDAYLQRRRNQVYDGNPPDEEEAPYPDAPSEDPPPKEKSKP